MTAEQFLLLLPETDRTIIYYMMKMSYDEVGDCNGIPEAEARYKEAIKMLKGINDETI